MRTSIRSAVTVPGTVVVGVAAGLLATACAPAKSRTREPRTHTATLEQVQRGTGPGADVERRLKLTATVVETPDGAGGYRSTVTKVDAGGDGEQAQAARRLVGREVLVGPTQDRVSLGPVRPGESGIPELDEVFLLFAALTSSQPDGQPKARKAAAGFGSGPSRPQLSIVDTPRAKERAGGLSTRRVDGVGQARISTQMVAYTAATDAVVAEPRFVQRFGGDASYPFATRTTTRTVTEAVPVTVTIPGAPPTPGRPGRPASPGTPPDPPPDGIFEALFEGLICIFSFGLACGNGTAATPARPPTPGTPGTPSRRETRFENRKRMVTETKPVRPPAALQAGLAGDLSLSSSRQLHQRDARVLSASGSGRMTLRGTLPSGDSIPPALRDHAVTSTSEWSYSETLVSPLPKEERGRPVLSLVALLLLVLVGSATGVTARRSLS